MAEISIECEPSIKEPCECCGRLTTRLTRFVYSDGDAFAVYYAAFTDGHPSRRVRAVISIGDWTEGASAEDREAFTVQILSAKSEYQVGLLDAAESPWRDVDLLGRMLDRAEALKHIRIKEVFRITDHIVADDTVVREYLDSKPRSSGKKRRK